MKKQGKIRGKRKLNLTRIDARKAVKAIEIDRRPVPQVMQNLGYSPNTSDKQPSLLTKSPLYLEEKSRLRATILDRHPKIYEKVADTLNEELGAEETKFFQFQGNVVTEKNVVDHASRLKAIEIFGRVFGELAEKDSAGGATINIGTIVALVNQSRSERGLQ